VYSETPFPPIDPAQAVEEIVAALRHQVGAVLQRAGGVVALSGGIDSAVSAALAVRAFGPSRVLGLALPEQESDVRSLALARELATALGIMLEVEDLTPLLTAAGCYARRDAAIARLTPFPAGSRCKLQVDAGGPGAGHLPLSYLLIRSPSGEGRRVRVPPREFREIVAATNYKQRARAMAAYHHADRLRYAVIGTPNRLEYRLGFFVKGGDGLADVKPIAHLYKGEVYRLAEYLGIPDAIRSRVPTTDTYSLPQTQEEFFFAVPLERLDQLLQAHEAGWDAARTARAFALPAAEVARVFAELERKIRAARYLHEAPLLVTEVSMPSFVEVG
jgi:NAD+ synthase